MKIITSIFDLNKEIKDYKNVGFVPTMGGIHAGHKSLIKASQNKKNKTYFNPTIGIGSRVVKNAQKNGLIVRTLQGDIVALCPPLIINSKEVDILFNKFNKSIKDTEDELNTEGLM